jgi:hypothetical protein
VRRALLCSAAVLAAFAAPAFDMDAWLARRARVDEEARAFRLVYSNCVAAVRLPAENVSVPVETWPDGAPKTLVRAEKAQFFIDEGLVWCAGVRLVEYARDGVTEKTDVRAASCVIDRAKKCGWAEGRVSARSGKTFLEGEGIYFSFSEEFVKIYSKVSIRTEDIVFEGVKL